jgi:hypothetical protein
MILKSCQKFKISQLKAMEGTIVTKRESLSISLRSIPCLLALAALFCSMPVSYSQETAPEPSPKPSPSPGGLEEISIPVPEGQDVMGIRIPHHNERGELVMLITAEVARRAGESNIEMERMKIDLWDEERLRSSLTMPKSQFHMGTRILSGNDGALIEREDFTIEGENLEFDLGEQKGTMRGKVTMTIKQVENFTP